jgi:tryptophan synthase beta chain
VSATDEEALAAFHRCAEREGIVPALESAHALAFAQKLARERGGDGLVLVNLSGRGDKDTRQVGELEALHAREAVLR